MSESKLTVGWICDFPGYRGGAELTEQWFRVAKPNDVVIKRTAPGDITTDVDIFVIQNCIEFTAHDIRALEKRPRIKYVHDMWPSGDPELRDFILTTAHLVFCSPLHLENFDYSHNDNTYTLPPAIDVDSCKLAAKGAHRDHDYCWIGSMMGGNKGIPAVEKWAEQNDKEVDFYGYGSHRPELSDLCHDKGQLEPEDVPFVLSSYKNYVFMPVDLEPFGRTAAEAHFCGCNLILNDRVGAKYWIENWPGTIESAGSQFWGLVKSVL